jgi:haloalkane dehalogenase
VAALRKLRKFAKSALHQRKSANQRGSALDFVGFGRSDKLTEKSDYSFKLHHDTLVDFIEQLALEQITLVVQDWAA